MKLQSYSLYILAVIYQSGIAQRVDEEKERHSTTTVVYSVHDSVSKCSKQLAGTLSKLCDNHFKIIKRDTSSLLLGKLMPIDLQDQMAKKHKLTFERWRRVRRQIADECCSQPCTIGQLILYCPEDAKLALENPDIFYYD